MFCVRALERQRGLKTEPQSYAFLGIPTLVAMNHAYQGEGLTISLKGIMFPPTISKS